MPYILSVSTYVPPNSISQERTTEFAKEMFYEDFNDIDRLLTVFSNGQIKNRNFSVPIDWYYEDHTLKERNDLYINLATEYGKKAIENCLDNQTFLKQSIRCDEIDAIVFISSTGLSTPSIDARIMNLLPFNSSLKRIPIWGLGCAGGAAGLSRAYEYCKAFPKAKVLVLCIELCSLTFQRNDRSKSNLVGTSLFSDGVACTLVVGDQVHVQTRQATIPEIIGTGSQLLSNSEDIMGWDVLDTGLHVVFSRSIPQVIKEWLRPVVDEFLEGNELLLKDIDYFIAHPGGRKVLEAYEETLHFPKEKTEISRQILEEHGNMSSPTVLYVLEEYMKKDTHSGTYGLLAALGPGFSSELVLVQWK